MRTTGGTLVLEKYVEADDAASNAIAEIGLNGERPRLFESDVNADGVGADDPLTIDLGCRERSVFF